MCGRFTLSVSGTQLAEHFDLPPPGQLQPRYNIAPGQPVLAVRRSAAGARELTHFRWGLIPSWSKDPATGSRLINARAETAAGKPSFRSAFKRRRCLIPASGFYEWQKVAGGKQPWLIRVQDETLFGIAGLWESWQNPDGGELETCTLLTTAANDIMRPVHQRMPVILNQEHYALWLDTPEQEANKLHNLWEPEKTPAFELTPVSTRVNNVANDDASCIEPDTTSSNPSLF